MTPSSGAYAWSNNIGWAAHQYATWVERDAGTTSNPHAIAGAPGLGDRFSNAGFNWNAVGENIAADWPMNVNYMHMGFAIDWGTGPDGIQDPAGHRNSMLSNNYTQIGIGIVDAGWTPGNFTQVQHFAGVFSTDPIVYGFVFDADGLRLEGALVEVYDDTNTIIGSATTDAIGAYTLVVSAGQNPTTAAYSAGILESDPLILGATGPNWILDVQMVPEPSSTGLFIAFTTFLLAMQRRRSLRRTH